MDKRIAILTFGNFAIGSGALVVVGLLDLIAHDLSVSVSAAGQLTTAFALAVALLGPFFATWTSQLDRRQVLQIALIVFSAGQIGAALSPNYPILMGFRFLSGIGACLFTPHAATAATLLVAPEHRGKAIATVFGGFILSTVLGVPLGTWLGGLIGWRVPMALIGGLPLIALAFVSLSLPKNLMAPPINLRAWVSVFKSRGLVLLIALTLTQVLGQLIVFGYLGPVMKTSLGLTSAGISGLFLWYGLANMAGNAIVAKLIDSQGPARVVSLALVFTGVALIGLVFAKGSLPATLIALAVWGVSSFAINSGQQARLVAAAPWLATATLPLNSSAIYAGQAIGAAVGGLLIARGQMDALGLYGAPLVALALACSLLAMRASGPAKPG